MTIRAQLGQRYRVTSVNFPEYGIGTVVKVNSDLSGVMQNEKGVFYFQHFDISLLAEDFDDSADESVNAIMAEIRFLEINGSLPVGTVSCFADLENHVDATSLLRKHVPHFAGERLELELQDHLNETVRNRVSLWLSLGSSVMS